MGAGESFQQNLWSSTFELQSKNSQLGIIKLTDRQTQENYVCRKLSLLDKRQIQQIDRLIDIKLSIQSPYIIRLQKATNQKHQQYCAYGKIYYLLFKQPYQTLKQQTLNRKFKNSMYSQTEIEMMLQVGVKALYFLKNIDHPHQNISSTAFFINQNRSMILGDPFMFTRQNQTPRVRNGFIYPSPELIRYQNHQIEGYNKHSSDLFTFGLVLLEVFYMMNMDCVYQRYFERVNHEIINQKLNGFKNVELKKKMFILLNSQPKNRQLIYRHYIKSISSTDIFNKVTKEKFKKNIDRYNLATSEVTQWKNDTNLEHRLNSSEGKRTFSVSTNQNPSYQDKTYGYSQNPQKVHMQPNILPNTQKNNFNQSQLFKTHNVTNNFANIKESHVLYQPSASYNPITVNFKPLPLYNPQHDNKLIEFKNPSYQASYQHYPPTNHFEQIPNSNGLKKFQLESPVNQLQSFSQSQYFFPKNPQFTTLQQKYFPSNISNNSNLSSMKFNDSSNNFISHSLYSPNLGQETLTISSDLNIPKAPQSITQVNRIEQDSNQTKKQDMNFQQTTKQDSSNLNNQKNPQLNSPTQNQNVKINNPILKAQSSIKETSTPSKEKPTRLSLDYAKYYHLSTINERSELTQSFISQTQQKKSEILIEEDQPNLQGLRQCKSQRQNIANSFIQQNKVWNITYPSGTKYMGEIKNDRRNGLGTFFYIDGSKYHGHWLDNKMNGFGTLYYPNGKIAYEGQWKMDNFHGRGKVFNDQIATFTQKYHYEDCTDIDNYWLQYDGQLFEDRKEGKGTLKLANGEYFEAEFKNDELNGHCKFYSMDNKVIQGIWENSKLVKTISEREKI